MPSRVKFSHMKLSRLITILYVLLVACTPQEKPTELLVSLVADDRELTYSYTVPVTVDEFLRDAGIALGELDRVNPPSFTQITDGMRVTVVRVAEQTSCQQNELSYRQNTVPNEGLEPGATRLGQAGQNGIEEVCYRVSVEDGTEREPVEISRTVLREPVDEVVYIGPSGELEPVAINGTLAYISNGNAWVMRGSSTSKRPLTTTSDLDPRVFNLSEDGQRLLITRRVNNTDEALFNQLWLIADTSANLEPMPLIPGNVLYADWVPQQEDTISYSTGEPRQAAPGWQAFNDLWIMRIDGQTGDAINVREVVERSSGGLYGWWGTRYQWSPTGDQLAWVQADSIGLVDLETGVFSSPLINYAVFRPVADWSWRATISWSPEGNLLLTTVHGAPVGSEPPESSPVFNIAATDFTGSFNADIIPNAGIWSAPKYSPLTNSVNSEFPQGYIAYLRSRDPFNSINGEYDLIVADRDGSNSRQIFPAENQPGLTNQDLVDFNFAWSPDGRQLACIYQGNLWTIDVVSGVAHQLTLDGGASKPVWTR